MVRMIFPIDYRALRLGASINFQINRWFGWVGNYSLAVRTIVNGLDGSLLENV